MMKIKIFVFTSEEEGQSKVDEWAANHSSAIIKHFELTSNKWNICLAIHYIEGGSTQSYVQKSVYERAGPERNSENNRTREMFDVRQFNPVS